VSNNARSDDASSPPQDAWPAFEKGAALTGLRVLDLSRFWAGPGLTEVLGNMGATVIKVESIQAIDPWREGGARQAVEIREGVPTYEISPIFNEINRNKYGLTLDLTRSEGQVVLKALAQTADLVVENYTPRVMAKFGLTFDVLHEINPRLILVSLPAFGSTGPWRDFAGFAWPTEQATGFPHLTGYPGDRPMHWGCAGADSIAAIMGAVRDVSRGSGIAAVRGNLAGPGSNELGRRGGQVHRCNSDLGQDRCIRRLTWRLSYRQVRTS
jgi:crotonobetainyl-CoA:carnitine CoA-transferase CaiB-like acyl-CoA transferase